MGSVGKSCFSFCHFLRIVGGWGKAENILCLLFALGGRESAHVVGGARVAANFAATRYVVIGEMGFALPPHRLVC